MWMVLKHCPLSRHDLEMRKDLYDKKKYAMDRVCYRYFAYVRSSDGYDCRISVIKRRHENYLVYSLRAIGGPTLDFSSST